MHRHIESVDPAWPTSVGETYGKMRERCYLLIFVG